MIQHLCDIYAVEYFKFVDLFRDLTNCKTLLYYDNAHYAVISENGTNPFVIFAFIE